MKERVFRFRAVEKRIAASQPGFRVLDVGCGRGDNLRRLVRYGGRDGLSFSGPGQVGLDA